VFLKPRRGSAQSATGSTHRGATASFRFRLVAAKLFPDALYLDVEPARPFAALSEAVARAFPCIRPTRVGSDDRSPFNGGTRQQTAAAALRQQIAEDAWLQEGIAATCGALVLIENSTGTWRERQIFRLAEGAQDAG